MTASPPVDAIIAAPAFGRSIKIGGLRQVVSLSGGRPRSFINTVNPNRVPRLRRR
jgi:hypothetical protein